MQLFRFFSGTQQQAELRPFPSQNCTAGCHFSMQAYEEQDHLQTYLQEKEEEAI